MFNICCDNKIPYAKEAFGHVGNVTYRIGNRLTSTDLKTVDLLFIRSGTRVDSSLLKDTPVQFVASATAGTDHIDKAYLSEAGIPFFHAPGCNADSVVEYIIAALYTTAHERSERVEGKCVGIVGAGNVGGRLARRLKALGLDVIVCDPPLLASDPEAASRHTFVELNELVRAADFISLHVPLVREGRYPTYHLFDEERLLAMKKGAWMLNASRGAVISNDALKRVIDRDHLGAVVLDVWEGEPGMDIELLRKVDIGTAHIAGYSYEGKVNGTIMVYEACMNHYGIQPAWDPEDILKPSAEDRLNLHLPGTPKDHEATIRNLVLQMYDIRADDARLKAGSTLDQNNLAPFFLKLRKEYPRRRSFSRFTLWTDQPLDPALKERLTAGLEIQVEG